MRKKMKKITITKIKVLVFLFFIGISGVMSLKQLMDYYVYDENPSSEWAPQMGDKLEADYSSVFWGKMQYVNLNGLCRSLLNQQEMNGITKLNNGWLASVVSDNNTDIVIQNAQNVGKLNHYLEENNIQLLYVIAPDTVSKYDNQLPKGVQDYTNEKLDVFVEELEAEEVNYIDLREEMYADGIDQYEFFYKTDHHWNVRGGLYAATKIIESAEKMLMIDIDDSITDINNYQIENYSKWHLGSRGQRVGRYFAGIDDFEIMYPKFPTEILRKSDGEIDDFKDVFISYDALHNKNYASRYTYDKTYQNSIENEFVNKNASGQSKLLFLTDSMGRVVIPYISLAFSDVDVIVYETITQSMMEEKKPDMMIIMLHPTNVFESDYFEFDI